MSEANSHLSSEIPTLATKLFAPALRDRVVRRGRLVSMLDQAKGAVLVSAPAGFGKSILLSDWLERCRKRSAWLSLEPADSEPRRFLIYFAKALDSMVPGLGEAISPFLQASRLPTPEVVLLPLVNALHELDREMVLVLDDFHVIDNPSVHALVEFLVEHLPAKFHLVLSTRVDPPFSLSRLRGSGLLVELRAADLRFSADESTTFLRQVMRLQIQPRLAEALQRRTEGWIVGLQMAALSMRGQADLALFVDAFTGSNRFVLDYLTDEVLARQPKDVLDFLFPISVLERFEAALCDFVLEKSDSLEMLKRLDSENLFLIPLDENRQWFRFHHLFRQLLEQQLALRSSPEHCLRLRQRASDWLTERGFPDEALTQALAAEDRDRTLEILQRFAMETLQKGDAATVTAWFERVPLHWVEAHPRIAVMRALGLFLAVRWNALEEWFPRLQELLTQGVDEDVEGLLLLLVACAAKVRADQTGTIEAARGALDLVPPEERLVRGLAAILLGNSLFLVGDYPGAEEAFAEANRSSRGDHDPLGLDATCTYYQGRMKLAHGHSRDAFQLFRRALPDLEPVSRLPMSSLPVIGEAEVHFEWGDLDRAKELAEQAISINRGCFPFNEMRARVLLADIALTQRDFEKSLDAQKQLVDLMENMTLLPWEHQAKLHRVRIMALRAQFLEDREAAGGWDRWIQESGCLLGDDPETKLLPEEPRTLIVTLGIRWLLSSGEQERALVWIQKLRTLAESRQWYRVRVETWLLEGLAWQEAALPRAKVALRQAIELAEADGLVQVLADEREWLRNLPRDVLLEVLRECSEGFRSKVLGAIVGNTFQLASSKMDSQPGDFGGENLSGTELPEALSSRELEVLAAVAAGGTNQVVGDTLFISPRTVKKHLENIYGKLGVHNRVEAIHRARSLGLLADIDHAETTAVQNGSS